MSRQNIKICDATIHPGETANLALPLPEKYSCSPLFMPINVIHSSKPGPCLIVFSVLKGSELNGLEIANRLSSSLTPQTVQGTVITIPVVNVYGLTHERPHNSLENFFPGDENGTFSERIAHLFTQEILKKADYCVELKTGEINHNILPQVYCNFGDTRSKELAKFFQTPVITNSELSHSPLRQTLEELQTPLLTYQAGEAMRFDENAINLGIRGIKNFMGGLTMLPDWEVSQGINPIFSRDEDWILAARSGILHHTLSLGQTIQKDQEIGVLTDPFGLDRVEVVRSPREGIVVGINMTPLIHEGLPIFKVASFLDYHKAESVIEEWDQKQPDSYIN